MHISTQQNGCLETFIRESNARSTLLQSKHNQECYSMQDLGFSMDCSLVDLYLVWTRCFEFIVILKSLERKLMNSIRIIRVNYHVLPSIITTYYTINLIQCWFWDIYFGCYILRSIEHQGTLLRKTYVSTSCIRLLSMPFILQA